MNESAFHEKDRKEKAALRLRQSIHQSILCEVQRIHEALLLRRLENVT